MHAAGWRVTRYHQRPLASFDGCAVEEYPTADGPADYALILNGRVIGIVEAKKLSLGPQNVLSQAAWDEFGVPFLYSTNGEVIWHHDIREERNRSRRIAHFHTPDALRETLGRDDEAVLARLSVIPRRSKSLHRDPLRVCPVPHTNGWASSLMIWRRRSGVMGVPVDAWEAFAPTGVAGAGSGAVVSCAISSNP